MLTDKSIHWREMKRLFHFNSKIIQLAIIAMLANIRIASGQSEKNQPFPIPENINKIFKTSCMQCHGSDGGRLPKSRLNFARWAGYDATKETEKALLICSTVFGVWLKSTTNSLKWEASKRGTLTPFNFESIAMAY